MAPEGFSSRCEDLARDMGMYPTQNTSRKETARVK